MFIPPASGQPGAARRCGGGNPAAQPAQPSQPRDALPCMGAAAGWLAGWPRTARAPLPGRRGLPANQCVCVSADEIKAASDQKNTERRCGAQRGAAGLGRPWRHREGLRRALQPRRHGAAPPSTTDDTNKNSESSSDSCTPVNSASLPASTETWTRPFLDTQGTGKVKGFFTVDWIARMLAGF